MGKNYNNRNKSGNNHNKHKSKFYDKRAPKGEAIVKKLSDLSEKEIGITEYVFDAPGFTGIIKARFSDFHVSEIDLDGNEAILTDLTIPKPPERTKTNDSNDLKDELNKLITDEKVEEIKKLISTTGESSNSVEINVTTIDKETRASIHRLLRACFGSAIVANTKDINGKKVIICMKPKKGKQDQRKEWTYPHDFTYFVVHKENVDTIQAAMMISNNLGCKPSVLVYAGTKDRRAKTSQWFCMRRGEPSRIVGSVKRIPNITVGNFKFLPDTLKLGQLQGNRFRIALRQVTAEEDDIVKSLESLKEKGFINYYGLQRFGNCSTIPTYKIGIAMLKQNFKEACNLIMQPRDGEPKFMQEMREFWAETHNSKGALQKLGRDNKSVEAKLLSGLAARGENDYVNALNSIPRNMRLLYLHAYQSFIWNQIASKRIKELGLDLKIGDLVYAEEKVVQEVEEIEPEAEEDEKEDEEMTEDQVSKFKSMVKPLTEDDINSGKYTIFDVVLPLPGHDITYPSNICGQWYEYILSENDLSSEKLKTKIKKYSLGGAYRKLLVKPERMTWHFMKYNSPTDTLIQSDMEKLKGDKVPESIENGQFKAVIIDFRLPTATYATMALRELLKIDTSAFSQNSLSKMENKKNDETENNKEKLDNEVAETDKVPEKNMEESGILEEKCVESENAEIQNEEISEKRKIDGSDILDLDDDLPNKKQKNE